MRASVGSYRGGRNEGPGGLEVPLAWGFLHGFTGWRPGGVAWMH